jgi:cupin fold WbuC family metalloprotein
MINVRVESKEVLYPQEQVVLIDAVDLEEIKSLALLNPRQRIRLCTHRDPADHLHEMFIVHTKECYVRPHKHIGKAESMAILEGEVDVILFHDDGGIREVVKMGDIASGKKFYYRMSDPINHMLLIRSKFLVFHEVTEGPLHREKTVFPEWAPEENASGMQEFIDKIESLIR